MLWTACSGYKPIGIPDGSQALIWAHRGVQMSPTEGFQPRVTSPSLDNLSKTAQTVNSASRRLNDAVEQLNAALKKLNLGVSTWVTTSTGEHGSVTDTEQIGYARVNGKWGVCLRRVIEGFTPDDEIDEWHFDDAPRDMRIRSMGSLHKLILQLNEEAETTAQAINNGAADAENLAATITSIAEQSRPKVSLRPQGGK